MTRSFTHENLDVYKYALAFCAKVTAVITEWDSKHAITDHLPRAAESVVEQLASAAAASSEMRRRALDFSLGSTLECAACFDIAGLKGLATDECAHKQKSSLAAIFGMLVGLRKSWGFDFVREREADYGSNGPSIEDEPSFHHERLDVYRVALDVMRWFCELTASLQLPARVFRKLDGLATSIILNVAEGNGRPSDPDQRRFLDAAHQSAIKMAAQLDVCVSRDIFSTDRVGVAKNSLVRVASMTAVMGRRRRGGR